MTYLHHACLTTDILFLEAKMRNGQQLLHRQEDQSSPRRIAREMCCFLLLIMALFGRIRSRKNTILNTEIYTSVFSQILRNVYVLFLFLFQTSFVTGNNVLLLHAVSTGYGLNMHLVNILRCMYCTSTCDFNWAERKRTRTKLYTIGSASEGAPRAKRRRRRRSGRR